jgi:hypothetical protein
LTAFAIKISGLMIIDVSCIQSEIELGVSIVQLAICIGELANKEGGITAFRPCLSKIGAHRSLRPSDLVGQRIFFRFRESDTHLIDGSREAKFDLVHFHIFSGAD